MVVSAVNGVKFNTHRANITFGGEAETAPKQTPKRAGNFVKVPVIVMMTLSPSLLNSAGASAENYQDDFNYPQTELLAMATPEPQYTNRTTQKTSSYVKPEVVQYKRAFSSNGTQYTMYWVNSTKNGDANNNYVKDVYFVPSGYKPNNASSSREDDNIPPRLTGIRYHDLPNGKEFVGAKVVEVKSDAKVGASSRKWYTKEIRLPDEVANELMDLVKGRTKFQVVKGQALDKMFGGANMEVTTSAELLREKLSN